MATADAVSTVHFQPYQLKRRCCDTLGCNTPDTLRLTNRFANPLDSNCRFTNLAVFNHKPCNTVSLNSGFEYFAPLRQSLRTCVL